MHENRGAKAGWTYGGLGSLLWMPILSAVLFAKGLVVPGGYLLVFFILGLLCVGLLAPWKRPDVSMGLLFSALPTVVLIAGLGTALLWYRAVQGAAEGLSQGQLLFLLPALAAALLPMYLPALLFAKQTWRSRFE